MFVYLLRWADQLDPVNTYYKIVSALLKFLDLENFYKCTKIHVSLQI